MSVLVIAWLVVTLGSFVALAVYAATPGPLDGAGLESDLPNSLKTPQDPSAKTWRLIVGLHPRCGCSQATAAELERLVGRVGPKMRITVYVRHDPQDPGFAQTSLVRRMSELPGAEIVEDPEAQETTRLGMITSGECLLLDPRGGLQFRGGVTSSRSHEGESIGIKAIEQLLASQEPVTRHAPTFGCSLLHEQGGFDEI